MRERKALATMGRKGGKKAAGRWNNRNSEYAQAETKKLKQACTLQSLTQWKSSAYPGQL